MKINCVLIDDEPLAIQVLEKYFESFPYFEVIASFTNALEGLNFLNNNPQVDVLFVDIKMPVMTGFELVNLLKFKSFVVITSAFREFAADSYEINVLDYLVKPIPFPRFIKCIDKLQAEFNLKNNLKSDSQSDPYIFVKVDKKMIKINLNQILFIEGMKEYVKIITKDKTFITHRSLSSLSEELSEANFIRVHKSYTIGIDKVDFIEGNRIQINNHTIPIGRNFIKEVKTRILE